METEGELIGGYLYLDAPALVICEVPVQAVEFVSRHEFQDALDIGYADGVAAANPA